MIDQIHLWRVVQQCSESVADQWDSIIAEAGLSAEGQQKARSILAETESLSAPEPHRKIGNYSIRRQLGEGGMGIVYEAEQESPRRTVALKILKPGQSTLVTRQRFESETRALGRLNHPGIGQIYEAGTIQNLFGEQHYFAMEFVNGPSLLVYAETAALNLRARLGLMCGICDAVKHAHEMGIIHRDLKPQCHLNRVGGQAELKQNRSVMF